jgi:Ser/Thr protein kinase RdoA (MazF antagonist)
MENPVVTKAIVLNTDLEKHRFKDGYANDTYKVDGQAGSRVLKIYHPKRQMNAEKESAVLMALRDHVPVPGVEAWGDTLVRGRMALLMEYVPFLNARQMRRQLTDSFYISAGETLGKLHRAGHSRASRTALIEWSRRHLGDARVQPFEQYYGQAREWLQILHRERVTMAAPLAILLDRMQNHGKYFGDSEDSFIHGDYTPKNLLTDGVQVVAVIDHEKTAFGDPNYDVQYFASVIADHISSMTEANLFLNSYEQAYMLPAYFEERRNFYRYYRAFQRTFRYRNDMLFKRPTEDSQEKLHLFLQSLVEYSDPWLSSRKEGVL